MMNRKMILWIQILLLTLHSLSFSTAWAESSEGNPMNQSEIESGAINPKNTSNPSSEPSLVPAATPEITVEPTSQMSPSISPDPTPEPSIIPTSSPPATIEPTPIPTSTPEMQPEPSVSPTITPEITPVPVPTWTPNPTPTPVPVFLDWGIEDMNIPAAWAAGYTGKGVKVAVFDTGIVEHEDLEVVGGHNFGNNSSNYRVDETTNHYSGHGTMVAGIIAAKHNNIGGKGVAPDVELYSVVMTESDGNTSIDGFDDAIDWAIANEIDIINMSFSVGYYYIHIKHAVEKAEKAGILIVAAAGNDHFLDIDGTVLFPDSVNYPARYESVVAVGGYKSDYSNMPGSCEGRDLDVSGPGYDVQTTYPGGYSKGLGTSFAAPYVTGLLALMKQAYPNLPPARLRDLLIQNAESRTKEGALSTGWNQAKGHGLARWRNPVELKGEVAINEFRGLSGKAIRRYFYVPNYGLSLIETPVYLQSYREKDGAPHANQVVQLMITRPNGNKIIVPSLTDERGVAQIRFIIGTMEGVYRFQFVGEEKVVEVEYRADVNLLGS